MKSSLKCDGSHGRAARLLLVSVLSPWHPFLFSDPFLPPELGGSSFHFWFITVLTKQLQIRLVSMYAGCGCNERGWKKHDPDLGREQAAL